MVRTRILGILIAPLLPILLLAVGFAASRGWGYFGAGPAGEDLGGNDGEE